MCVLHSRSYYENTRQCNSIITIWVWWKLQRNSLHVFSYSHNRYLLHPCESNYDARQLHKWDPPKPVLQVNQAKKQQKSSSTKRQDIELITRPFSDNLFLFPHRFLGCFQIL